MDYYPKGRQTKLHEVLGAKSRCILLLFECLRKCRLNMLLRLEDVKVNESLTLTEKNERDALW